MKNSAILILMIISVLAVSCGGSPSNDKEDKNNEPAPEKIILDSKEAMMSKLDGYNITIPGEMVFRSVDKQVYLDKDFEEKDTYLIYFDTKEGEEVKKEELLNWFNSQIDNLKNKGWTVKTNEKDKEMIGGGTTNQVVLVKDSENCTLDIRLGFNDERSSLSIHPKYETE
ncbi:MAG: hypothetical protein K9J25_07445 [Bacteroidales bacterium]|nr:hypothetical protein [Bacteroidales bacterium]